MLSKLIPVDLAGLTSVEYSLSSRNFFNILLLCDDLVVVVNFLYSCVYVRIIHCKVQFGQRILVVMSIFGILRVKY